MRHTIRLLLSFFLLFTGLASVPGQPFAIGHLSQTYTDPARNRSVPVELYYPADQAGDGVPVALGNGEAYPVLVFGHGFVMSWDAYQNIWEALVPAGYILAFPRTETGFSPQHAQLGADLSFVRATLADEGLNPASLFYQRVASGSAAMGHSMGGGASFLAMAQDTFFTALVNFAAAETSPSAIAAATGLTKPALLFAGANDCVTPISGHQQPMYDSLLGDCKTLVTILGGSHCQMAESNFFCEFGESTCTPAPAITRAEQHAVIERFILPWLDAQLKGDCPAGLRFDSLVRNDTTVSVQRNCVACLTTAVPEQGLGIPTPFTAFTGSDLRIQGVHMQAGDAWTLFDLSGRCVWTERIAQAAESCRFTLPEMAPGLYLLRWTRDSRPLWSGPLVR